MSLFGRKNTPVHSELIDGASAVGDNRGCAFEPIRFVISLALAVVWYGGISWALFQETYWIEKGTFVRLFPEPESSEFLYLLGFYTRCCFCFFSGYLAFSYCYWRDSVSATVGYHAVAFVVAVIAAAAIVFYQLAF